VQEDVLDGPAGGGEGAVGQGFEVAEELWFGGGLPLWRRRNPPVGTVPVSSGASKGNPQQASGESEQKHGVGLPDGLEKRETVTVTISTARFYYFVKTPPSDEELQDSTHGRLVYIV
jgi:hypothetical protein